LVGTLRGGVEWANGNINVLVPNTTPNVVMFDTTGTFATPQTTTLSLGQLTLSNTSVPESIVGTGVFTGGTVNPVTVSGNMASRVFQVNGGVTATISGMTITKGRDGSGAGLYNNGTLTLSNVAVTASSSVSLGGCILNRGNMTITNSTISGNNASIDGGGITNDAAKLAISNSTLSGNTVKTVRKK
jgi:hypothetical protein